MLTLIAFFSEFLGTLSGFGSSTFFVPTATWIESFQLVLALTGILHCFGNLFRMALFREHFRLQTFLLLALPTFIFTAIGATLTSYLDTIWMLRFLGWILIVLSLHSLLVPKIQIRAPKCVAIVLSSVSGFSTGFVGTGGAFRGIALKALLLPKDSFIVTSATIDLLGDGIRTGIYLHNGFMDWNQWFYVPLLGLAAWFGARSGQKILSRINQKQFENIVSIFVFASGLLMLNFPL